VQYLIKTISADRLTPVIVFKKLNGIVLLESAVLEMGRSRYSFIVLNADTKITLTKAGVLENTNGQEKLLTDDAAKFLDIIEARGQAIAGQDFPFPLPARGVGYLSYEFCRFCDTINITEKPAGLEVPEACFIFGSAFVVFDHYRSDLHLVAIGDSLSALEQTIADFSARLTDSDFRAFTQDQKNYPAEADPDANREAYLAGVEQIKQEIIKGNLIQGVLAHQLLVWSDLPAFEAYCRLRRENPSPYLFYFDFQDYQLFGASPEVMVQISGAQVLIKPIAGTRPRGQTAEEDRRLEKELLADEKERAEHLMLIDLARNDCGRFAVPGSVQTTRRFFVERYTYVMHLVSEVLAQRQAQTTIAEIIRSVFPAGTVSGAPKIKAIELISAQEPVRRGPYAGLIGYFDINGNFDSCITIRSVLYKDKQFAVQAGAGIVYDSVPEKEYRETINKARAAIRSLGISL